MKKNFFNFIKISIAVLRNSRGNCSIPWLFQKLCKNPFTSVKIIDFSRKYVNKVLNFL